MNETTNGLHKCQPKNAPIQGEIKNFAVLHMSAREGKKPWIKIKSEMPEKGGSPFRVVSIIPKGWPPDDYGNVSFNLEVEPVNAPEGAANAPESPPVDLNGDAMTLAARKHIMQSANLYVLCVAAVEKYIAHLLPEIARTSEMFQAATGTLFIEASRAGFVAKMPTSPITPIK